MSNFRGRTGLDGLRAGGFGYGIVRCETHRNRPDVDDGDVDRDDGVEEEEDYDDDDDDDKGVSPGLLLLLLLLLLVRTE